MPVPIAALDQRPDTLDRLTCAEPDRMMKEDIRAAVPVRRIRGASDPGMMEVFVAEYGLSRDGGVALMCLAGALMLAGRRLDPGRL